MTKHAISVARASNFPEWYQEVVKEADMAEHSGVRGCMVIKPWGYAIWENIQRKLDGKIRATGHDNCYFPLFIPLDLIKKEAEHVKGFAKEMAVVTHHRLVEKDGDLVLEGKLETPLVVRPTSEIMIGESFAKWIKSYRDLPVKINQWANVVRWEMRPRLFLRTSEFLWQEGHTAHATEAEAMEETMTMLEAYRELVEDFMRIPVIVGEKSESERFPGAVRTYSIEAMMQDGKALQAGTSHFLGQNFARAANIEFQDRDGNLSLAYTTSWGVSTRLIGAMIMTHGDDDGLRLPPQLAPSQVVIIPVLRGEGDDAVLDACKQLAARLRQATYKGEPVRATVDTREGNAGPRRWGWVKKGAPLILEIGPRDLAENTAAVTFRTDVHGKKQFIAWDRLAADIGAMLGQVDEALFEQAKAWRAAKTRTDITDRAAFDAYFKQEDTGFVVAKWCGDAASEESLKELAVSIRNIPVEQDGKQGTCVLTGKPATLTAVFAKSY
ncbi:MAG: proline--tRNA ligase [Solirubrobacterales bacterium]